ncbi:MAG: T9SS type A sorting domain-containing protein, partial [Bacteroidota bacterium]
GSAQWVRITYDIFKSDWSGLDYSNTWWIADDTTGSIDGTIDYDFTIPEDASLTADFPDAFPIIQVRVEYDPANDTFWNIFVAVESDSNATAIFDAAAIEGISMYPNPASEGVIYLETPRNLPKQVMIADLHGRIIKAGTLQSNGPVDVSELSSGVYTVSVKEGRFVSTLKLVKE